MPTFEVIRAWHGVVMGEVFDSESVHPALASHVREAPGRSAAKLVVATPADEIASKNDVVAELKKRGIPFDGRKSVEELSALLDSKAK